MHNVQIKSLLSSGGDGRNKSRNFCLRHRFNDGKCSKRQLSINFIFLTALIICYRIYDTHIILQNIILLKGESIEKIEQGLNAKTLTTTTLSLLQKKAMEKIEQGIDARNFTTSQDKLKWRSKGQNIIMILIDDLGIRDLSCYGSKFYETPNIDKLASDGVMFKNAYAAHPMCLPSRVALMSGTYPHRFGQPRGRKELPKYGQAEADKCFRKAKFHKKKLPTNQAFTLGKAFKEHGYNTAWVGKWQMGNPPEEHGYDVGIGHTIYGSIGTHFSPYYPKGHKKLKLLKGLKKMKRGTYMTNQLTTEAIDTIKKFQSKSKDKPFFLALSHYAVHTPLEAPGSFVSIFENKRKSKYSIDKFTFEHGAVSRTSQDNAKYAAMLKSVDENIGRLRSYLKRSDLENSTTILFTSDNGGLSTRPKGHFNMDNKRIAQNLSTANTPYRGGKFWLYQGGIKVPLIIFNGEKQEGTTISKFYSIGMDVFPTLLDLAGLPLYPSAHRDGMSLVPALTTLRHEIKRNDTFFYHYPSVFDGGEVECSAALSEDYKLIEIRKNGENSTELELFDLNQDPYERINIVKDRPHILEKLLKDLRKWRQSWVDNKKYTEGKTCNEFLEYDQWKDLHQKQRI